MQSVVADALAHLLLLGFVAAEDVNAPHPAGQQVADHGVAGAAGTAGDGNDPLVECVRHDYFLKSPETVETLTKVV